MFFHWEMRIGIFTYTSDTHSQRQYTHLSIQTQTVNTDMAAAICGKT